MESLNGSWTSIIGIINLIAGVQGIFLGVLLNGYPAENRRPNRILSLLVFAFSFIVLGTALGATELYRSIPHLIRIGDPVAFLIGPSLLMYVTAIRTGRIHSGQLLHYIPFCVYIVLLIPFYISAPAVKIEWVEVALSATGGEAWFNVFKVMHAIGYFAWVYYLLFRHSIQVRGFASDLKETDLSWLRKLTGYLLILAFFALLLYLASVIGFLETLQSNFLIGGLMAVLIYVIGYRALTHPRIFGDRDYPAWQSDGILSTAWGLFKFNPDTTPPDEYIHQEQKLLERLQEYMQRERPYRENDLSLSQLSSSTGIPQYLLSRIINSHLNRNFFDFVNEYRVREVCEKLHSPEFNHLTILAIAMEAGFGTKSSFNSAFRKVTGITPSVYRKQRNLSATI